MPSPSMPPHLIPFKFISSHITSSTAISSHHTLFHLFSKTWTSILPTLNIVYSIWWKEYERIMFPGESRPSWLINSLLTTPLLVGPGPANPRTRSISAVLVAFKGLLGFFLARLLLAIKSLKTTNAWNNQSPAARVVVSRCCPCLLATSV